MHLAYSTPGDFPDPLDPTRMVTPEEAAALGIIEDMPFLLDDSLAYQSDLNRILRSLAGENGCSRHTWRAYGQDIAALAEWLQVVRGKLLFEADYGDLTAYRRARLVDGNPSLLRETSWNRAVAAMETIFGAAVEEGLIKAKPFRYRKRRHKPRNGAPVRDVEQNRLVRHQAWRPPRPLSAEEFLFFRDVGLRGWLPGGKPDPASRKRTGFRDAVMGNVLFGSGLRIEEASTLLRPEVLSMSFARGDGAAAHGLAAPCAKGNRSREIYVPALTVAELLEYDTFDRANAVELARRGGIYCGIRCPTPVVLHRNGRSYVVRGNSGEPRALASFGPATRGRLVEEHGGVLRDPAWFFLTERGRPLPTAYWWKIFERASVRCRSLGWNLDVSPHDLRHSYAVHTLAKLRAEMIRTLEARASGAGGAEAYDEVITDPLWELKTRLGHADVATTYLYLEHLPERHEIRKRVETGISGEIYGSTQQPED
jgi:site-specific recombinase XerD